MAPPDGPLIMAELVAEVEGGQIVAWRERTGSLFQDIGPDGEVLPLDRRLAAASAGALLSDALVSRPGVITISGRLVERRGGRGRSGRSPLNSTHRRSHEQKMQILDRLNGCKRSASDYVLSLTKSHERRLPARRSSGARGDPARGAQMAANLLRCSIWSECCASRYLALQEPRASTA